MYKSVLASKALTFSIPHSVLAHQNYSLIKIRDPNKCNTLMIKFFSYQVTHRVHMDLDTLLAIFLHVHSSVSYDIKTLHEQFGSLEVMLVNLTVACLLKYIHFLKIQH